MIGVVGVGVLHGDLHGNRLVILLLVLVLLRERLVLPGQVLILFRQLGDLVQTVRAHVHWLRPLPFLQVVELDSLQYVRL